MKKYSLLFIGALFLLSTGASAQEIQKVAKAKSEVLTGVPADTSKKAWLIHGTGSILFSQSSFSNWSAGGQNSVGLTTFFNLKANYKKNKHMWANTVDLGYGFNILGKLDAENYTKTNDKIELTSAYGYELHNNKKWYVTVLANFRTQFDNGYEYKKDAENVLMSTFMTPGYLVAGIGITYSPVSWFNAYLSPASGRFTFVTDQRFIDMGAFGVEKGKSWRGEFGPYMRMDMNKDIMTNVNLASTLELFSDYLNHFGNIDVNWSLLLSMKVNKWLSASLQTQLLYDDDVIQRTQFKEIFGIGLTYKLN